MSNRQKALSTDEEVELLEKSQMGVVAGQLAAFARQEVLGREERSIRAKIFEIIDSSKPLDPVLAVQAWIELRSAYKLIAALEKLEKLGTGARSTLSQRGTQTQ
jgi:hypothetical protein